MVCAEGGVTGGRDGHSVAVSDGDIVRTGKRSTTREITIVVGHMGGGTAVHDPTTLAKGEGVHGRDQRRAVLGAGRGC